MVKKVSNKEISNKKDCIFRLIDTYIYTRMYSLQRLGAKISYSQIFGVVTWQSCDRSDNTTVLVVDSRF